MPDELLKEVLPLQSGPAGFGCLLEFGGGVHGDLQGTIEQLEKRDAADLLSLFYSRRGLLVWRGLQELQDRPELLVRLTQLFGQEVENYRQTITTPQFFHPSIEQILVLSNQPPCNFEPPAQPDPPLTDEGRIPLAYPIRTGWHTDQSYRSPPPDTSLLYGLCCPPASQGQTLYADGISAWRSLPAELRKVAINHRGIHSIRWVGRTRIEVCESRPVKTLLPHQQPQCHPLVRTHPVSGERALYLCDPGQMDYIDGPIEGLGTGPDGEGAKLVEALVRHVTHPDNVYVHEWQAGDLVIHDNRNTIHTATWYDSARYPRTMWRTTAMGNPGGDYHGTTKSWIPEDDSAAMQGLESLKF